MEQVKVIIRYADGRLIKGFTNDFFPNKSFFHISPVGADLLEKGMEVFLKELKAVFFVKDFAGNASYNEEKSAAGSKQASGRKVEVTFRDGEVIVGSTMGYDPLRPGFFVTPADPLSNNLRIFIISSAVSKFRFL